MGMEIVSLKKIPYQDWIKFVDHSDEAWFFHRPEAHTIADPAFQGFGLTDSGKLLGICILYARRILGTSVLTYHAGAAGPALCPSIQHPTTYALLKRHLITLARQCRCSAVYLTLPVIAPANLEKSFENSHLQKLDFKEGMPWGDSLKSVYTYTSLVNLSQPSLSIFQGFYKTSKAKCKQAMRLGLNSKTVFNEHNEFEWQHFIANHHATFKRSGGMIYGAATLAWLKNLIQLGFAQLINFYQGNTCAASLLLITYKRRALYFASGVQPQYYEHGVSAYMHWVAIQQLAKLGYEWYELGQTYPTLSQSKFYHIGQFKRTFGGLKIPILAGTLVTSPLGYTTGLLAPKLAKKMLQPIRRRFLRD